TTHVQRGITAHRALGTDGSMCPHFPGTGCKAEVGSCQRANRADVSGVSRKNGVERRFGGGDDPHAAAAIVETKHRLAYNLILEADAARALDTALLVQDNQVAQWNMLIQAIFFIEEKAALARPVGDG